MTEVPATGTDALLGHTGFVGGNLARQHHFAACFNSRNIDEIAGREFDLLVIAAVQAKKWWANQNPGEDWARIDGLLSYLATVRCRQAVLISTIDVLPQLPGIDESFDPHGHENQAYGINRLRVEDAVRALFANTLVVRLPGLFGHGLRKNVIYDLLTNNQLEKINPASSYQYYDLARLMDDVQVSLAAGLQLVHLFTEPLRTAEILDRYFPDKAVGRDPYPEAHYDCRTRHADLFGGPAGYVETRAEVLTRLGRFIPAWRSGEYG